MNEKQARARAHPRCIFCEPMRPCTFHSATTPQALAVAVRDAIAQHAGIGLAELLAAGFAQLEETLPEGAHRALARIPQGPLMARIEELVAADEIDADSLRELAASALALALVAESQAANPADAASG